VFFSADLNPCLAVKSLEFIVILENPTKQCFKVGFYQNGRPIMTSRVDTIATMHLSTFFVTAFKDALPVSFRSELFAFYILTIFKQ